MTRPKKQANPEVKDAAKDLIESKPKTKAKKVEEVVEEVEVEEVEEIGNKPELFGGQKMYWKRPMAFGGRIVKGLVLNGDFALFKEKAPKDIDVFKWIDSVDRIEEKRKRLLEKNRGN